MTIRCKHCLHAEVQDLPLHRRGMKNSSSMSSVQHFLCKEYHHHMTSSCRLMYIPCRVTSNHYRDLHSRLHVYTFILFSEIHSGCTEAKSCFMNFCHARLLQLCSPIPLPQYGTMQRNCSQARMSISPLSIVQRHCISGSQLYSDQWLSRSNQQTVGLRWVGYVRSMQLPEASVRTRSCIS